MATELVSEHSQNGTQGRSPPSHGSEHSCDAIPYGRLKDARAGMHQDTAYLEWCCRSSWRCPRTCLPRPFACPSRRRKPDDPVFRRDCGRDPHRRVSGNDSARGVCRVSQGRTPDAADSLVQFGLALGRRAGGDRSSRAADVTTPMTGVEATMRRSKLDFIGEQGFTTTLPGWCGLGGDVSAATCRRRGGVVHRFRVPGSSWCCRRCSGGPGLPPGRVHHKCKQWTLTDSAFSTIC